MGMALLQKDLKDNNDVVKDIKQQYKQEFRTSSLFNKK